MMTKPAAAPQTKKSCLRMPVALLVVIGVLAACALWLLLNPNSPLNKASATECVCEWARLAPLPVPNDAVHIETRGGMFTREFILSFRGTREEISTWLLASPSTRDSFSGSKTPHDWHRELVPGGGAQFAEITLSENGTKVVIRAYWS